MIATAFLALLVASPATPPAVVTLADERAALISGFASWERSIQTIETKETFWQPTGNAGEWARAMESERGFAGPHEWYMRTSSVQGQKGGRYTGLYVTRGSGMLAVPDDPQLQGMVKEPDDSFFQAFKSQATMLGRWCDPVSYRSLSELFRDGQVAYLAVDPANKFPGLRWTGKLAPEAKEVAVDVRIDPASGFAPVSWTMLEPATGIIADHLENLRFTVVDGVHVPTIGVNITWSVRPTSLNWEKTRERLREAADLLAALKPAPVDSEDDRARITAVVDRCVKLLRKEPEPGQAIVNFPTVGRGGPPLNPMLIQTQVVSLNRGFTRLDALAAEYEKRTVREFEKEADSPFKQVYEARFRGQSPASGSAPKGSAATNAGSK